jgi:hypothetical protein
MIPSGIEIFEVKPAKPRIDLNRCVRSSGQIGTVYDRRPKEQRSKLETVSIQVKCQLQIKKN